MKKLFLLAVGVVAFSAAVTTAIFNHELSEEEILFQENVEALSDDESPWDDDAKWYVDVRTSSVPVTCTLGGNEDC